MDTKKYKISGMSCAACVARVEKAVSSVHGVQLCEVNLLLGSMRVTGDATDEAIVSAVERAGYGAENEEKHEKPGKKAEMKADSGNEKSDIRRIISRLIPSSVLLLFLMYISMGHVMWGFPLPGFLSNNPLKPALSEMLISAVIILINKHFYQNGTRGIVHRSPNMDTLVSLGSFASFVYSFCLLFVMSDALMEGDIAKANECLHGLYFESAAMILVLISIGKLLEAIAKGKTTSAIKALIDLTPKMATVERNGEETLIPASDIMPQEIFIVKRGESIPADGIVISGEISIDESALTGESIPRDASIGDNVLGATVILSGYAKVRAVKVGEETAIAEVIKMVKEASGTKAPVAKAADKVAGIFVPAVMLIALISASVWLFLGESFGFALARGVSVLVISCPCALGLATPVAVMVGSGVGARCGILFKNAESLEMAGKIKTVAFDKTGTLTEGKPTVTDVISDSLDDESFISLAYALEYKNEHPLAKAIVTYATEKSTLKDISASEYTAYVGGVSAVINGKVHYCGNLKFIGEHSSFDLPDDVLKKYEKLSSEGKTVIVFVSDKYLGMIALADKIRSESIDAVGDLKHLGIRTVMITGDNKRCADSVASELSIDEVYAEVLPSEKASIISSIKKSGGICAMVGDGVNDSVALTESDVGIAIGAGSDIAIDSADVVLKSSSLASLTGAIKLSRRVLLNIYENLFWAFFYNIIGIPLAAGVFIPLGLTLEPMFGAAAMSLSSFLVVSNALRLNLFKPIKKSKNMQTIISKKEKKDEMKTVTIKIEGMMCPHCSGRVKAALEVDAAVISADVSHERGDAVVTCNESASLEALEKIVTDAGYKVV